MSDDEMAEVILQTGSIMGDELCQRCGTKFMVDHYCAQGHMKPVRKDNPTTGEPLGPTSPGVQATWRDTTSGEWTVEWIAMLANKGREDEIVAAHKAALAAEREKVATLNKEAFSVLEENKRLTQQLAAERKVVFNLDKQVQGITEALITARQQLAAATARELHSYDVAKQCRDELAAERLRANQKEGAFMVASDANQKLRDKLAAAVEALKNISEPTWVHDSRAQTARDALAKIGGKPDDVEIYYDNRGGDN